MSVLTCTPGNYEDGNREPATIITIANKDRIEPLVFSMDDTRSLVAKLLVTLATYEDEFAQKLLDDNFPADDDGNFVWPRSRPPRE